MRHKKLVPLYLAILSMLATVTILSSPATSESTSSYSGYSGGTTIEQNNTLTTNDDVSQLPKGNPGTTEYLIEPSPYSVRPGSSRDTFRTNIRFTHFLKDDPIVYAGKPGASHLHMFLGNALLNASTTAENIRTNCRSASAGGTANCTGYWVPALLDANGNVILPNQLSSGPDLPLIYYKAGYDIPDPTKIVAPPVGLRMIAGDKNATPSSPQPDGIVQFWCHAGGDAQNHIVDCPQNSVLEMEILFPRCWDGKHLDSPNHQRHMAYANNGCPASHPVIIPEISFHIRFPVNSPQGTAGWRLSSDMYDPSQTGGYSLHADWFNGWDPAAMKRWVTSCDRAAVDCGVDVLGDGGWLSTKFIDQ